MAGTQGSLTMDEQNVRVIDRYAQRNRGQEAEPIRPNAPPRPGAKRAPVPAFNAYVARLAQQGAVIARRLRGGS